MTRIVLCGFVWLSMNVLALPSSHAVNQTRILQQGLTSYTGVRDTWISTDTWAVPPQDTVNYGQNSLLQLERNGGDNPLLRFDLSGIPANSQVVSAGLSLYNQTAATLPRRVNLHRVLVDWDEGNQVNSPVNAPGRHGATGWNAFDYYSGEGSDVAWSERGMAGRTDYFENPESYADVLNTGWYTWDVTDLVRAWVRGETANFGMVLRDGTGYQEDNPDVRDFVSSQDVTAGQRPKLTIVYNPDVPFADAGPDQENLMWNGGAVTLDGSGSHDRPGGNDAALSFSWRIVRATWGSTLGTAFLGTTAALTFTPDTAGEWEIELTLTNELGESATDTVCLRLLSLSSDHPRIYLTPAGLAALKARALPSNPRWTQLKEEADDPGGSMHAKALAYQITGGTAYGDQAVAAALALIADSYDTPMEAGDIALVFDWCHDRLTAGQVTVFVNYFNQWGDDTPKGEDVPGWTNYWPRYSYSYGLIGLASHGHNPRAREWLDEYRCRRFRDNDLKLLDHIADGGAWPEGVVYDWIANWSRIKALEAWRTATGEDLFESCGWFRNRLGYLLLQHWPGREDQWGNDYHPYLSTGDSERMRGSMANYGRIISLILAGRYPDDPVASQLQGYLGTPPVDSSMDFVCHEEFLWFDPTLSAGTPQLLTHYSQATGTLMIRSGWPDGPADTSTDPTYATFQCGDHFTYHQHYDQNSFTLFKHGDLALDSGVYSGDGLSHHDANYYVRTIAHNTLLVHNPQEDFSASRPSASSNDGGQRSMYPASRTPDTLDYFNQHLAHYDTGEMLRHGESPHFTYALGDATNAYNNPGYNQAMDTGLSGNVAKVSRFQREFVYLRPRNPKDQDFLVLFDRVGVTQPGFSGQNTKLLFHTLNEPAVNGTAEMISPGETLYSNTNLASAVSGDGKLFITFLLPAQKHVRKIGGRGIKAFWVFDDNYDWHWDPGEAQPRPVNDFEDLPYGEWRLELEPADTALFHTFLTVLEPAAALDTTPRAAVPVTATGMTGVHISDSSLDRVLLFSSAEDASPPAGIITYGYQQGGYTRNILFDLQPGARYTLSRQLTAGQMQVSLTPDVNGLLAADSQGVLTFADSAETIFVDPEGHCSGLIPCFTTIQAAVNGADTGSTVKIAQGTYPELFVLDQSKQLTLLGGWNSVFLSQSPGTTVLKAPKVMKGSLTLQTVIIRP